ncbi:hypothetical protein GCM10020367_68400 [Streptomyces sannanensis]|uniref:HTH luxR-type domain-containing protein n=1 Tax=Streptomyces sannanensis TaxID=285536 RepID=A0ABP6SMY5_9ACTN
MKSYVSSILARLGVENRAAAAVVAHQAGLIPPAPPALTGETVHAPRPHG